MRSLCDFLFSRPGLVLVLLPLLGALILAPAVAAAPQLIEFEEDCEIEQPAKSASKGVRLPARGRADRSPPRRVRLVSCPRPDGAESTPRPGRVRLLISSPLRC